MIATDRWRFRSYHCEWLLSFLMLLSLVHCMYVTWDTGYLPAPFYPDSTDTFRDWFSVAVWAHLKGAYDSWLAVYPPLSFLLIKYLGVPECYTHDMYLGVRDCDWVGIVMLHLFVVLNGVVASLTFLKLDRRTALPRAFTFTAGMPMLFGLERGNIILLCITTCMLAWGPLLRSARARWLFAGLAVNFKVYLIAGVLVQLIRRRWLAVEGAVIVTIIVYLISYGLFGEGNPLEILSNLINFAQGFYPTQASATAIWYNTTYSLMYDVLNLSYAPVTFLLGSTLVAQLTFTLMVIMRVSQLIMLASLAFAWLRPEVISPSRLILLGLGFVMMVQENPPYAMPIILYFVFMEPWKGRLVPVAIVSTYLVSFTIDLDLGSPIYIDQYSYIGSRFVTQERALQLGMFIRPLGHTLIPVCLALDSIMAVLRDIRDEGWQGRWRFRHDAPILPRVSRPIPPHDHAKQTADVPS